MEKNNNSIEKLGFTTAKTYRASQEIARQIQSAIISGQLEPGDKLPSERELVDIFGRSRPTVREALRILEKSGLIKIISGLGAVVCEMDEKQVVTPLKMMLKLNQVTPLELFKFRLVTETAIVRWAAENRTNQDIKRMENILKLEEEYRDDWEKFHKSDMYFHESIAEAAKNSVAEIFIKVLHEMLVGTVSKAFNNLNEEQRKAEQKLLLKEHKSIFEAIKKQDPDEAAKLFEKHITQFRKLAVEDLTE